MTDVDALVERAKQTQHGFMALRAEASEIVAGSERADAMRIARQLLQSEAHQARIIGTFILGALAAGSPEALRLLRAKVNRDSDWRVQEILAQAFDSYCCAYGYEKALPVIESWLADRHANVRRAASEGLRIWTSRPYLKEHPEIAIRMLSGLRDDSSEYVRKSAGNALRDISRRHMRLIKAELGSWDLSQPGTYQTYKLVAAFTPPKAPGAQLTLKLASPGLSARRSRR